jgi:hypothetical protein
MSKRTIVWIAIAALLMILVVIAIALASDGADGGGSW